jgi:hypothetical protein
VAEDAGDWAPWRDPCCNSGDASGRSLTRFVPLRALPTHLRAPGVLKWLLVEPSLVQSLRGSVGGGAFDGGCHGLDRR